MRRLLLSLVVITSLVTIAGASSSGQWANCEYLPGRAIVDFTDAIYPRVPAVDETGIVQIGIPELDEIFQEFEVTNCFRLVPDAALDKMLVPPDLYRSYVIIFRSEYPVLAVLDRFEDQSLVNYAMPDLLYRSTRVPNDPRWGQLYDKRLMGEDEVWDFNTGSAAIIVAGIDTGVDWNHPDLGLDPAHPENGSILWVNPDEDLNGNGLCYDYDDYPGDTQDINGFDDGANGYVDDFLGWDFIRNIGNCDPDEDCNANMDNDMFGLESHGTHVAGIMAAHGNNGVGIAGASWGGTLMALRCGYRANDGQGYMPESATTPGIIYACNNGAKVINMSYGGGGASQGQQNAINAGWAQGCIFFGASGNDGVETIHYPAGLDNVIAVNATDENDVLAGWSNRGTWTDLCAPGVGISSTVNNGYASYDGTSMASPNAGGVAALLWSVFPDLTNAELRDLIFESAEDITQENPNIPANKLGHGRASAVNAVAMFFPRLSVVSVEVLNELSGDGDLRLETGETGTLRITVTNEPGWAEGLNVSMNLSSTDPNLTFVNATANLGNVTPGQTVVNSDITVTVGQLYVYQTYDAVFQLTFNSDDDIHSTTNATLRIGRGNVILIADDGNLLYEANFTQALTDADVGFDVWHTVADGEMPESELMHYHTAIWSCGDDEETTFTDAEQATVTAFLNAGRNLIAIGQYIDEDLRDTPFYANILHASSEQLNGDRRVLGVTSNEISDGLSLLLQGSCASNGNASPSRIMAANGGSVFMTYQNGGNAAVSFSNETYRVAYFAFALEAACGNSGTDSYSDVLSRVLAWMDVEDAPENGLPSLPSSVELRGNYPNPFNPSTTIEFALPTAGNVKLDVFDVQGRLVSTLMSGAMSAGHHQVEFDGSAVASGVYFARLQAGDVVKSHKMVMLK